jgi:DNA-binding LytR/AlgR family response regulator
MKAVIVDDERGARLEIRRLLKPHSDVEIIAEAATADEALSIIERQEADLLFLDIQMPEKTVSIFCKRFVRRFLPSFSQLLLMNLRLGRSRLTPAITY